MRDSPLLVASFAALVVTSSGCMPAGYGGYGPRHVSRGARLAVDSLELAGAFVDLAQAAEGDGTPQSEWTTADDSFYTRNGGDGAGVVGPPPLSPGVIPPHVPASAADQVVGRRAAFDLGGAYASIARVDLDACKARGLAPGYGRVILGFGTDGAPDRVTLELPAGSAPASQSCVETAFQTVQVAPFDGSATTVRRQFFVKG